MADSQAQYITIRNYLHTHDIHAHSIEELPGGIHNDVLLVQSNRGSLVYKKHRPISKTYSDIRLPPHRYETERDAYQLLSNLLNIPITPQIVIADDAQQILVMEYIDTDFRTDGIIDRIAPEHFRKLGGTLAVIARQTYDSEKLRRQFSNHAFQELKYEYRYYRFIKNSALFPVRDWLMQETRNNRLVFVHGDPRLNNIFFRDNSFYFIDFEGAYYADFPLDVAYLLSELCLYYFVCRSTHMRKCIEYMWQGYISSMQDIRIMPSLEKKVVKHLGFAMLDKVIGVIKKDYGFVTHPEKIVEISESIICRDDIQTVAAVLTIE